MKHPANGKFLEVEKEGTRRKALDSSNSYTTNTERLGVGYNASLRGKGAVTNCIKPRHGHIIYHIVFPRKEKFISDIYEKILRLQFPIAVEMKVFRPLEFNVVYSNRKLRTFRSKMSTSSSTLDPFTG
jgi:hypothetical protein